MLEAISTTTLQQAEVAQSINSSIDDTVVPLFSKVNLLRCEDEQIHVPGAVQDYGCMVVVIEQDDGTLALSQVSENCNSILGYSPKNLLSLASFYDCLEDEQADLLSDNLGFLSDSPESLRAYGPHVFLLTGFGQDGKKWTCWCAAHEMGSDSPDDPNSLISIILEFEPVTHNGNIQEGRSSSPPNKIPGSPNEGLSQVPYIATEEQIQDSTEKTSKPLRALAGRRAQGKRRRRGHIDGKSVTTMEADDKKLKGWSDTASGISSNVQMGELLGQVNDQLSNQTSIAALFKTVVGIMLDITSYTRVAVYQFDNDWSGKVVAELVDMKVTHDLFQGLHFPAGDIPKQARDLYKLNKVRILFDRDATTSKMVSRRGNAAQPVDMTYSFLRAMSPYHVLYVEKIGVRSSMSLSITVNDQLWGLILMHHYGDAGKRVSFPLRMLCLQIGESITRNIERLQKWKQMSIHDVISTTLQSSDPNAHFFQHADQLLTLFQATYGVLVIGNKEKLLGPPDLLQECSDASNYLKLQQFRNVLASNDVANDLHGLSLGLEPKVTQRALIIPLSTDGHDFLAVFRKLVVQRKNWAGKPTEENLKLMQIRKSFSAYMDLSETESAEWEEDKREAALILKLKLCKEVPLAPRSKR